MFSFVVSTLQATLTAILSREVPLQSEVQTLPKVRAPQRKTINRELYCTPVHFMVHELGIQLL
jgi:hypothetical protein